MHKLIPLSLLLLAAFVRADDYERQPAIDVLHYDISLELSDANNLISGVTRLQVLARRDGVDRMWLDFASMSVDKLLANGVERPFVHRAGRLSFELDRAYRQQEIAVVEVRYHGKCGDSGLLVGTNRFGRRVFFAENWPDHARRWFPSVDHPSDKATVDFAVTAPEKYDVISNGRLVETRSLLDGRKLTRWSETVPIPTYCMVIGAAEFSIASAGSESGVPLEFFSYPQDASGAARKFARTSLILQYFAAQIGPFPYEKLAQVESTTRIGGMENSSAIFYTEALFKAATVDEAPVPHEVAHQWFGDSVTPADWDHLWLSEGFATYFDALFYENLEGPAAMKQRMTGGAAAVKRYHQTHPSPMVDNSIKDLMSRLNAFNYDKGAWILHMLRKIVGEKVFFNGIRRYYSLYSGRTALSEDFQRAMEAEAGISLDAFFTQWLYQPGWPEYHVDWRWNAAAGQVELGVRQAQAGGLFDMPVDLAFRCSDRTETRTLRIWEKTQSAEFSLPCKPVAIEVDPDGWTLNDQRVVSRK